MRVKGTMDRKGKEILTNIPEGFVKFSSHDLKNVARK